MCRKDLLLVNEIKYCNLSRLDSKHLRRPASQLCMYDLFKNITPEINTALRVKGSVARVQLHCEQSEQIPRRNYPKHAVSWALTQETMIYPHNLSTLDVTMHEAHTASLKKWRITLSSIHQNNFCCFLESEKSQRTREVLNAVTDSRNDFIILKA